jgi:HD superfamily phosphodiesterase
MTKRNGTQGFVRAAMLIGLVGALAHSANAVRADAAQRALPAPGTPAPGMPAAGAPAAASDWHVTVRELAAKHFKNPAWGYSHNMRDYALARELAAADHATLDDDVLFAAAYLHDIAAFPPWAKEKVDHSDVAADLIDTILKGTGFPMTKVDAVRGAIRTHMYYRDPVGPEALYLHDADALDWLGAIGVARIFGLVDPQGGDPDGPKAVKMLEDNLKNTPSRVLSPAGKALLPARKLELEQFLKELRQETENLKTL